MSSNSLNGDMPEWVKEWIKKARPYVIGQPGGPEDAICALADRVEQQAKEITELQGKLETAIKSGEAMAWEVNALQGSKADQDDIILDLTKDRHHIKAQLASVQEEIAKKSLAADIESLKSKISTLSRWDRKTFLNQVKEALYPMTRYTSRNRAEGK